MADYERKKRNLKYGDLECKRYLRKDFKKTCAYCGVREGDLSGPDSFQIDHFVPRVKTVNDSYENLFYCCATCNGRAGKSDYSSLTLLNPCIDDIYKSQRITCDENDFFLKAKDELGEEFINAIKLNRKSYIKRRKTIYNYRKQAEETISTLEELLKDIKNQTQLINLNAIVEQNKQILAEGQAYLYSYDEVDRIEEKLEKSFLEFCDYDKLFDEYNIDYLIKKDKEKIYIHFDINDIDIEGDHKDKVIKESDLQHWKKLEYDMKIIYYNSTIEQFFYSEPIKKAHLNAKQDSSKIRIKKENTLSERIFNSEKQLFL